MSWELEEAKEKLAEIETEYGLDRLIESVIYRISKQVEEVEGGLAANTTGVTNEMLEEFLQTVWAMQSQMRLYKKTVLTLVDMVKVAKEMTDANTKLNELLERFKSMR